MKSKGNIVFLGMMGSGKSTIGKLVSKKLNINFFDTDQKIEEKFGLKISKIFEEKGESFFRKIEEKITLETLKKKNIVIALGGGSFLNKKIREEILNNHLSIWLNWSNYTIIKRVQKNNKRPLASNKSKTELISLIKSRSNIYSKALHKIDCDNLSKSELVNKVINFYEAN